MLFYVRIKERRRNRKWKQRPILQTNDNRMTWPSTRWDICPLLYVYHVAPALQNYAAGTFSRQKQVHDGNGRAQCKRVKKMQKPDGTLSWRLLQIVMAVRAVYGKSVSRKYASSMTSRSRCISRMLGCGYKFSKFKWYLRGESLFARLYHDHDVKID